MAERITTVYCTDSETYEERVSSLIAKGWVVESCGLAMPHNSSFGDWWAILRLPKRETKEAVYVTHARKSDGE
jgi:hypothetical protein